MLKRETHLIVNSLCVSECINFKFCILRLLNISNEIGHTKFLRMRIF